MSQAAARKKLGPLLAIVQQHRAFVSALLYEWMNSDRGIPGVLGGEAGMKNTAKKPSASTVIDNRRVWFSPLYGALKFKSNWKNPRYDTARAAALATFLKRDFLHLTKSAAVVLAKGGFDGLGSHSYVGLGEVAKVDVPAPTTATGMEAAAQAAVPAEDIDWGKITTDVLSFIVAILPFLDGLMQSQDTPLPAGQPAAPGVGTQAASLISTIVPTTRPAAPAPARAPAPAPAPAPVSAAKPPMAVIAGGAVLGLGLVYLLTRKKKR
jgi:hypothetical protein